MSEDLKQHDNSLVDEALPANPEADAALGREVRFGLALLGLLMAMLGAALYVKLGMPGLKGDQSLLAAADEVPAAATEPTGEPALAAQAPIHVPAHEEPAETPAAWNADRYARNREAPMPPDDAPLPVGSAASPAELPAEPKSASNPFDNAFPVQAAATEPVADAPADGTAFDASQGIPPAEPALAASEAPPFEQTPLSAPGAEEAAPNFSAADLPSEPPLADAPLAVEDNPAIPFPGENDAGNIQTTGAKEPTLAPPRNAPYGRNAADRYAAAPQDHGPRAAPMTEHTPLHAVPNTHGQSADPYDTPLERELQQSRTPRYNNGPQSVPHAPPLNELDAPASEFAAPQDNIAAHERDAALHHPPAHQPSHDGTYTVAPNDSFWTISQKAYGTPSYFKAVQRHNRKPGSHSDGLEIGEKILVPPVETLEQKYPELCPKRRAPANTGGHMVPASSHGTHGGRIYVVEEGDTLFDIARFELGKASRWSEIYDLNRHTLGSDYDYIAPGTKLMLPDNVSREPEPITSRPGAPFSR